jgi:hypothetical protein
MLINKINWEEKRDVASLVAVGPIYRAPQAQAAAMCQSAHYSQIHSLICIITPANAYQKGTYHGNISRRDFQLQAGTSSHAG